MERKYFEVSQTFTKSLRTLNDISKMGVYGENGRRIKPRRIDVTADLVHHCHTKEQAVGGSCLAIPLGSNCCIDLLSSVSCCELFLRGGWAKFSEQDNPTRTHRIFKFYTSLFFGTGQTLNFSFFDNAIENEQFFPQKKLLVFIIS